MTDILKNSGYIHWINFGITVLLIAVYGYHISFVLQDDTANDFYVYFLAAEAFSRQQSAYTISGQTWDDLAVEMDVKNYTAPYYYPPLTAQLVWPLTYFSASFALLIWLVLNSICFILSGWLLGVSSNSSLDVTLALMLTLGFAPTLSTLSSGQVNGLLLLSLCIVFYGLSRQKWFWAGLGLSVGVMLKVLPLAHLGYLVWRTQWKVTIISVMGILFLLVFALPFTGWNGIIEYSQVILKIGSSNNLNDFHANQALSGIIARYFGESVMTFLLWWGIRIILIVVTLALCWPKGNFFRLFDLEFALVTTTVSMIMPVTWYHQLVLLLIPIFVVAKLFLSDSRTSWMLIPLGIGYGLTSLYGLGWLFQKGFPYWITTSIPFCFMFFIWGLLVWSVIKQKFFCLNGRLQCTAQQSA